MDYSKHLKKEAGGTKDTVGLESNNASFVHPASRVQLTRIETKGGQTVA